MRQSTNVGRDNLLSLGTCFGKFTKTRKFRQVLQIHCNSDHTVFLTYPLCSSDYIRTLAKYMYACYQAALCHFISGNCVSGVSVYVRWR
jgi:UPF0113 Pre-PUA domain